MRPRIPLPLRLCRIYIANAQSRGYELNFAPVRTAIIIVALVALGAFALFSIGGATAQQACIQPLAGNGTVSGSWDNTCLSENTPLGDYNYPIGTRYARFYTFTLSAPSTVTMELRSSTDTYMYLMQGTGKTGTIQDYNDDVTRNENPNSRISQSLTADDFTIEATTYDVETTGSFTLTVSGLPDTSTPTATATTAVGDAPTATSTPISRQATPTFMPTRTATSTITPTPTQPPAPDNILNRLTALETRAATQQELISTMESKITALDSRVAALESGVSTPMPTATPEPTQTPTATPIATNSPTPQPGNLGTRSNPVPLRQFYRPTSTDPSRISPWQMRVVSVNKDAWSIIQSENRFNDEPPDPGNRYVLIEIEVENLGSAAESFFAAGLDTVGSSNVEFDARCKFNTIPERFDSFRRIFPGGKLEGNVCFEVLASDTATLLLFGDEYDFDAIASGRSPLWFWNLR